MSRSKAPQLVRGVDYYLEDGKLVFTAHYHLKRGSCCHSRCRHCPYGLAPGGAAVALPSVQIVGLPGGAGSKAE